MKTNYTVDKIGNKYHYDDEGNLHSMFDEPAVILESGEQKWYYKGLLHREEKPAVQIPGYENQYYEMGQKHRMNGPAIESIDGEEYWINGNQITKEQFNLNKKLTISLPTKNKKQSNKKI